MTSYNPGPDFTPTSGYGPRPDPFHPGQIENHPGQDFAAPAGTDVPAASEGIVVYSGYNAGGYGNTVIIELTGADGQTYYTLYAHLNGVDMPHLGQGVVAGAIIGEVGSTGHSTGPHLHFEILDDDAPVQNTAGGPLGFASTDLSIRYDPNTFNDWNGGSPYDASAPISFFNDGPDDTSDPDGSLGGESAITVLSAGVETISRDLVSDDFISQTETLTIAGNGSSVDDLKYFNGSGGNETEVFTSYSPSQTEMADLIDFTNGLSEQDLFQTPGYAEQTFFYSGVNGTGLDLRNVFNLLSGVSEEQLFFGLPGGYVQEDLIYSGQNLGGNNLLDIFDAANGTSAEAIYTSLPIGATAETELFSGPNGTGAETEDVTNFSFGTSEIQLFNPYGGISEEIQNFSALNGSGQDETNIIDFSNGTSQIQIFAASGLLTTGETAEYLNASGTGGSGADTITLIDYSNGISEQEVFSGIPGYTDQIYYFSSPNATGTDLENIFNLTNGEFEKQLFVGTPPGYTQEDLVFSGQNLSGTDLVDILDATAGGSVEVLHGTLLPIDDSAETEFFSGPGGTGLETESVQNLRFGSVNNYAV